MQEMICPMCVAAGAGGACEMSESSIQICKGFEYWKAALLVCFGWRHLAIQITTMRSRALTWPSISDAAMPSTVLTLSGVYFDYSRKA